MKVIWFVNVHFPEVTEKINQSLGYSAGWLQQFRKSIANDNAYELAICSFEYNLDQLVDFVSEGILYYVIPKKKREAHEYDESVEKYIKDILEKYSPDIIHVWGTEYPHALSVGKVAKEMDKKAVYSIQGLIGDYSKHYLECLENKEIYGFTFRDFLRKDNLFLQKRKYEIRGTFEEELLTFAENVIGRTSYDFAGVKEINPKINYYFCNECLRESFYENTWNIEEAEKDSIFISQAYYPIKGFHIFLEALNIVKKEIPGIKVYVAGGMELFKNDFRSKLRKSMYMKCLEKRIQEYDLKKNIIFLGGLQEKEMCHNLLKCRLFVSPSLIENSPNSVGEAMILGVPVVSSYVGGVRDMITDKVSGLTYPVNQPNMLAQQILSVLKDDELSNSLSIEEKIRAQHMFNIEKNTQTMKEIYKTIVMRS